MHMIAIIYAFELEILYMKLYAHQSDATGFCKRNRKI